MTANKTTQITLQTTPKRARLSRKAARDAQRATDGRDGLTVPSDGPATLESSHASRSISAQASLSDSSVTSSHLRSLKTFKASITAYPQKHARLVPRAYKRGGKNKPIVIRDSSSGEVQEIRLVQKKKSAGLNTKATSENGPIELRSLGSGPVETLSELRIMQTRVFQSLVNRDQNAERKKHRKAGQPKKTEHTPSCSSQELSRPPMRTTSGSAGATVPVDGSPRNPAVAPVTVADVPSGCLSAGKTRNMLKSETKICDVKDSVKESTQLTNDSACGSEVIDSINPEVTIKYGPTNKPEQVQDNTCSKDKDSSFVKHLADTGDAPVSPKALLKSKDQIANSSDQEPKFDLTVVCNTLRIRMPSVNSDLESTGAKLLMDQKELTTTSISLKADNTKKQKSPSCINDLLQRKDLCHRAKTPGSGQMKCLAEHLEQTAVSSSILARSLAGLNPRFVNSATDIRLLEQPLDTNEPGLVPYNRRASINHVSTVAAGNCLKMHEITRVQGTLALSTQQPELDVEQQDNEIYDRQLKYIRGDNTKHDAQKAEQVAALSGVSVAPITPRARIDESRLEAQSAGQFGEPVAIMEHAVSVFDPVATVSKFLDLVTYPLKFVWRIAYRV